MKQSETKKDIIDLVKQYSLSTNIPVQFVEKDIYVVEVLSILANIDYPDVKLAFSGGTCLSKAYNKIKRFSEDMDFCIQTKIPFNRNAKSKFRKFIMEELNKHDNFEVIFDPVKITDENSFFSFEIKYNKQFESISNLRKNIKIEFKFENLLTPTNSCEIKSLMHDFINDIVVNFNCVSISEILANKLSALVWRVYVKDRTKPLGSKYNDPTIVRHLYDLSALETELCNKEFAEIAEQLFKKDLSRGNINSNTNFKDFANKIINKLEADNNYKKEYTDFVETMCYDKNPITFDSAVKSLKNIISYV
jgi:predicted nucleotidyltransferase component of viral defense system